MLSQDRPQTSDVNRVLSDVKKAIEVRKEDLAAKAIEAGTAETGTGSVHESAVAESDLPESGHPHDGLAKGE